MSIDIALLDHKVAIECDGPSHFEKNLEKSVTHKTILRNRGLERRGWRVLMIPYYEWREVVSNDKHQKYLEDKLATIGITQPRLCTRAWQIHFHVVRHCGFIETPCSASQKSTSQA